MSLVRKNEKSSVNAASVEQHCEGEGWKKSEKIKLVDEEEKERNG